MSSSQGATHDPARVLPLKGGRNFRDLGGYAAADGRRTRWRTLYRSGALSGLTAEDYAVLGEIGIASVVDLRSNVERTSEPTVWRGAQPRMYARDYALDLDYIKPQLINAPSNEAVRQAMATHYRDIAYQQAESYTALFAELAEDRLPLAFHCSAGKDRAGVAAALILTALGVPRWQVVEDYALSEKVVNYERAMGGFHVGSTVQGVGILAQMAPERRAPFLRSDPFYLETALADLDEREGSVENFIRNRLGVSDAQIAALRDRLLTAEA